MRFHRCTYVCTRKPELFVDNALKLSALVITLRELSNPPLARRTLCIFERCDPFLFSHRLHDPQKRCKRSSRSSSCIGMAPLHTCPLHLPTETHEARILAFGSLAQDHCTSPLQSTSSITTGFVCKLDTNSTNNDRHSPQLFWCGRSTMQRVDPRPVDPPPQSQEQQGESGQQQPRKWNLNLPAGFANTGSQAHTQSFEEIYGVPENFLEIEVRYRYLSAYLHLCPDEVMGAEERHTHPRMCC